jgi:basic membrane protein A and related proteins
MPEHHIREHAVRSVRSRRLAARGLAIAMVALAVAACGSSVATPAPSATAIPTSLVTPFIPSPSPTPQLVKSVTLVAPVVDPAAATLSGLAWAGAQSAATKAGARAALVEPADNAELAAAVDQAAAAELAIVVTIGPETAVIVATAAVAHPDTQFIELGVDPGATAPANVHGLAFDEAEAGYLAGFVAASFSASGKVGYAGTTTGDTASANYSAGFATGAALARADATATTVLAGTASSPDHGRTAAATLVKGGADVVASPTGVVGIASLREACGRKARLVAIETDAWQVVPDVRSCLIASVTLRYDVALAAAISTLAAGGELDPLVVESVATGAIAVTELHADPPAGFSAKLAGVIEALRNDPPRSSPAPVSAKP